MLFLQYSLRSQSLQPDAAAKRKARYKVCKSTQFSLVQKENRCNCGKLLRRSDSFSWSYRNRGLGLEDHCGKQTWTWSTPGLHRSPSHVQGSHHHYALIWVRWCLLRGSAATRGPTMHTCPLPYLLMLGYHQLYKLARWIRIHDHKLKI
jgi:hypothetical protein